ncbi:MAG TPA: hydrogenase maturation nickel metallochaperone HypA [Lutibacter sp.]|nr:hydrogenase maturation nickel metallochaperone HypA [Lutibacter sp.]
MHEMSIAIGIVNIATDEAKKANVENFAAIDLEIGTLAGIEYDSLDFVWEAAIKDSVLEKAIKNIHKIQAKAKCVDCENEFPIKFIHDSCPKCGSFLKIILQGKELRVKSLETF